VNETAATASAADPDVQAKAVIAYNRDAFDHTLAAEALPFHQFFTLESKKATVAG